MKQLFIITVFLFAFMGIKDAANAQWELANGPYGGTVTCLAVSGDTIFAGTDGAGLFLSTNNGNTWKNILYNKYISMVSSISMLGKNVIAIINGNLFLVSYNDSSKIYEAKQIINGSVSSYMVNGGTIFVSTLQQGLFRSKDNGVTWAWICEGLSDKVVLSLASNDSYIYAGTGSGMFYSSNDGQNWSRTKFNVVVRGMAVVGPYLFAVTDFDGIYRSSDNGEIWTRVNTGMPNSSAICWFLVDNKDLYAGTYTYPNAPFGKYYKTSDYGDNWSEFKKDSAFYINQMIRIGSKFIAATRHLGILISQDDGENWTESNTGITNMFMRQVISDGNYLYANSSSYGVYRSIDNGESWHQINNGLTDFAMRSIIAKDTFLFAGTSYRGILRSSDKGESWTEINNGFPYTIMNCFPDDFVSKDGYIFVAAYAKGVYRSSDNGDNWIPATIGMTEYSIGLLKIMNNNIYSAGYSKIHKTTNNGERWWEVKNNLNTVVHGLAECNSNLFAGNYVGLYKSTDNGQNWILMDKGLKKIDLTDLTATDNNLFASSINKGVFISTKDGENWTAFNEGLIPVDIYSLYITDTMLYAATRMGIWRRPLADTIVSVKYPQPEFPENTRLSQNYPNPFNSTTTITYKVPATSFVKLSVFNRMGQEVALLVNGMTEEGEHKVVFDAGNLPSDIYFYHLQAGNYAEKRKLILVK